MSVSVALLLPGVGSVTVAGTDQALGGGGGGAVRVGEYRQGRESRLHLLEGDAIIGRQGDADAKHFRPCRLLGKQRLAGGDQLVRWYVAPLGNDVAGRIDEDGCFRPSGQSQAERHASLRLHQEFGDGIAACIALAARRDEAASFKAFENTGDGRLGQSQSLRQVATREGTEDAQELEHDAGVMVGDVAVVDARSILDR